MAGQTIATHRLRRHFAFYVAALAGLAAGTLALFFAGALAITIGANTYFAVYVLVTAAQLPRLDAKFLRTHAADADAPAVLIFLVMIAVAIVSAVSLFLALAGSEKLDAVSVTLGALSVVLGWFAVHTMWAMHYAYEYYKAARPSRAKGGEAQVAAGLAFAGGEDPDGTAFVYFAYVIGMTAQTSDTEVTSNAMRRIVLAHSVFAFFFNTVIVAAAVNIVVSIGH